MNFHLKDIATISVGYPFRGRIQESAHSHIKVIQLKNVDIQQGIDWQSCVNTELTGKRSPEFLRKGMIVQSTRGGHYHAFYVDDTINHYQEQFVVAPHFFVFTIHNNNILPEFLAWQLNQSIVQQYLEMHAVGSLTKSISRATVENTPIIIPTMAKQQAIIKLVSSIEEQRQVAKRIIANGKQVMTAIMQDLV